MARIVTLILLYCCACSHSLLAQEKKAEQEEGKDTTKNGILDTQLSKEIIDAITKSPSKPNNVKNIRSEDVFRKYEGKIIRKIIVHRTGFEYSIYDTAKTIKNRITKIANALHSDTQERVIRDNLFFSSGNLINPYKLADNERYLRDLDFILDSKISVRPVRGTDSVDVTVTTRDVFSLGIRAKARGLDKFSLGLYDANLFGWGQRVQSEFLFERGRFPFVGTGLLYSKSSVMGTLVNLSAGYTQLNNGISAGEENEYSTFFRLDRPLVSPYSRLAGGLEISKNWSANVYNVPDSLFKRYRYNAEDLWGGYNIGIKNNVNDRSRHFIALRYFRQDFGQQPIQESDRLKRIYNNQRYILGEFTFYNQNFYKTNYVYGFGRTEDIPYGQTVNITAGWADEVGLQRIYVGSSAIKRIVRPNGRFYDLEAGAGGFFNKDVIEDGILYGSGTYYSKPYLIGRNKVRHQFSGGYARAFNNRVRELLTINNNELRGFSPDSLFGYQRLFLRTETTVFTNLYFIGFRFAPFLSLEGAFFQQERSQIGMERFFWGSTGGVRVRNENLIFGTVEFRAFYFPTVVAGVQALSFKVTTNVRIKYTGSFVRPPSFLRYN
jgi:hypothetical protein